jgi:catechol 2,3-dioxygenase-like lactoylglutathione lyase family enzyme
MSATPLFHKVDAVTIPVPDLDTGLRFYRDSLGHELRWRNDAVGQAGLALAAGDTEIVLTTRQGYEPDWLVASADEAAAAVQAAGGVVTELRPGLPADLKPAAGLRESACHKSSALGCGSPCAAVYGRLAFPTIGKALTSMVAVGWSARWARTGGTRRSSSTASSGRRAPADC